MLVLIGGLLLFVGLHVQRRMLPAFRRDLIAFIGDAAFKGVLSLLLVASLVFVVIGYRSWDAGLVYSPFPGAGFVNNLLMIASVFLFGVGFSGGPLSARIRHPMLLGVLSWSVAHLLVNGDGASVVMFGTFGIWAVAQMRMINQHEGPWVKPMPGNAVQDAKLFLTALFIYVFIAGVHWLFGLNVFSGNY
jgi:uncharacterized membrane protein